MTTQTQAAPKQNDAQALLAAIHAGETTRTIVCPTPKTGKPAPKGKPEPKGVKAKTRADLAKLTKGKPVTKVPEGQRSSSTEAKASLSGFDGPAFLDRNNGQRMTLEQERAEAKRLSAKGKNADGSRKISNPPSTKPAAKKGAGKKASGGNSQTQVIADLLKRKDGCTTADILKATGWKAVNVPRQARTAGLTLKQKKDGKVTRYWGN